MSFGDDTLDPDNIYQRIHVSAGSVAVVLTRAEALWALNAVKMMLPDDPRTPFTLAAIERALGEEDSK
jgi:hypothetical protein